MSETIVDEVRAVTMTSAPGQPPGSVDAGVMAAERSVSSASGATSPEAAGVFGQTALPSDGACQVLADPRIGSLADSYAALDHFCAQTRSAEIGTMLAVAALVETYEVTDQHVFEGMEQVLFPGGDGTTGVGEFLAFEISARMMSAPWQAMNLITDVINVSQRHLITWKVFLDGKIPWWQAAYIASSCNRLSKAAAEKVETKLARILGDVSWSTVTRNLKRWITQADPDKARQDRIRSLNSQGVWVDKMDSGDCAVGGKVAAKDGIALDHALNQIAHSLPDPDPLIDPVTGEVLPTNTYDRKRAAALGVLVNQAFGQDTLPTHTLVMHIDARDVIPAAPCDKTAGVQGPGGPAGFGRQVSGGPVGDGPDQVFDLAGSESVSGSRGSFECREGVAAGRSSSSGQSFGPGLPGSLEARGGSSVTAETSGFGGFGRQVSGGPAGDSPNQVCDLAGSEWMLGSGDIPGYPAGVAGGRLSSSGQGVGPAVGFDGHSSVFLDREFDAAGRTTPGAGIATVEKWGEMLAEALPAFLSHSKVIVKPILDPASITPRDAYQVPDVMRFAVEQRNPIEVFPYGTRAARACDLDHTRPFIPGESGQTRMDNLGPLSRKAHRAKTHGGWYLQQPSEGVFLWESPSGARFLVTDTGTTRLDAPPAPVLPDHAWIAATSARFLPKPQPPEPEPVETGPAEPIRQDPLPLIC